MNFKKPNTRPPPRFNKVRVYNANEIGRPAMRAGTTATKASDVPRLVNRRGGVGNYNIKRVNFTAPELKPRAVIDFGRLASVNTSQFGQKVQLSDKTLDKLFRVSIPDPTDKAWLAEKERLLLIGRTDKPFGREQRTIRKRINFGEQSQGAKTDISLIQSAINEGFARTREERALLGAKISQLLANTEEVKKLNQSQVDALVKAIGKVRLSPDWWNSFPKRIYSGFEYMKDGNDTLRGNINMFILAHVRGDRSNLQPLESWNSVQKKFLPAQITLLNKMRADNKFIDLATSRVITFLQSAELVEAGVDGGSFINNDGNPETYNPPTDAGGLPVWEPFPDYLVPEGDPATSKMRAPSGASPVLPQLLIGGPARAGVPVGAPAEEVKEAN